MLRRTVKRTIKDSMVVKNKRVRKKKPEEVPLGSKKDKDQTEHELESLVLGGDDDLIEKLNERDKVNNNLRKVYIYKLLQCKLSSTEIKVCTLAVGRSEILTF